MSNRRLHRVLRLFGIATLTLWLCLTFSFLPSFQHSIAQANDESRRFVQIGVDAYQNQQFQEAIQHWQAALDAYPEASEPDNRAIVLQNLARAYRQTGQFSDALTYWQQTLELYRHASEAPAKVAQALTEQAQVHLYLGQPLEAIALLCGETHSDICAAGTAVAIAEAIDDRPAQVAALGSLGEAYRALQEFTTALEYSEEKGVVIAQDLGDTQLLASLYSSIGKTYSQSARANYLRANATAQRGAAKSAQDFYDEAWQQDESAQKYLKQSSKLFHETGDYQGEARALLDWFDVLARPGRVAPALEKFQQALSLWETLPNDQVKASIAIRLTKAPRPLVALENGTRRPILEASNESSRSLCQDILISDQSKELLEKSLDLTRLLENKRLESFALGELGHFYECRGEYSAALKYTQEARLAANDALLALDGLHLWHWQAGRIYRQREQLPEAIAAYKQATRLLDTVRSRILATTKTLQFDFRDAVTPVYRELAALEFSQIPPDQPIDQATTLGEAFSNALGNIDDLQLAELQNYFGSDCLVPIAAQRIDQISSANEDNLQTNEAQGADTPEQELSLLGQSTALISTAILPNRTAVTLTLPNRTRYLHWIEEDEDTLRQEIIDLLDVDLKDWDEWDYDPTRSTEMYNRLIHPFDPVLDQAKEVDTLVFAHDGLFRSLPMAALYADGRYLIERYAIANTPSLKLRNLESGNNNSSLNALIIGVTQSNKIGKNEIFPELPSVESEVKSVKAQLGNSLLLLDKELNLEEATLKDRLRTSLQRNTYSVLHVATHGKFEAEAEDSFLVLGEESVITLGELDELIRKVSPNTEPLELIVLSACQTATGDDRAALGLAGVTVRAGAKSALATLWSVGDDTASILVREFYRGLVEDGLPKAKALQEAQKFIIEDNPASRGPARWAPFILIGNWQ